MGGRNDIAISNTIRTKEATIKASKQSVIAALAKNIFGNYPSRSSRQSPIICLNKATTTVLVRWPHEGISLLH